MNVMYARAQSLLWFLLSASVLAGGVGAGHALAPEGRAPPAGHSGCAKQKDEENRRMADWGWEVFGRGSGSPVYRL